MREETYTLFERDLMYAVGGQLFSQAPNNEPRNVEILMKKVRDRFREDAYSNTNLGWVSLCIPVVDNGLYKYIDKLLRSIPEFVDLNLSQNEYNKNIKVDDESRLKYIFTSAYSSVPWGLRFPL